MIVKNYTKFSNLPFEMTSNILSFISFYDIFQNNLMSVSCDVRNILNCLLQISVDEVCINRKNDILKYVEQNNIEVYETNQQINQQINIKNNLNQLYIFKPNLHSSVQKRLFNIVKKQPSNVNCIFIANPYTNIISPLLKVSQNKIVLLLCTETMIFERQSYIKDKVK